MSHSIIRSIRVRHENGEKFVGRLHAAGYQAEYRGAGSAHTSLWGGCGDPAHCDQHQASYSPQEWGAIVTNAPSRIRLDELPDAPTGGLDIRVASTADEARAALAEGYEPVECAFGSESVVGPLGLDHHGDLSHRDPVCRQVHTTAWCAAARSPHIGRYPHPSGYVVSGPPDADATLAIALIECRASRGRSDDYAALRHLVGAADLGYWRDLSAEGHAGAIILAWHARQRARRIDRLSPEAWVSAVQDWADLLALPCGHPELIRAQASEAERVRLACEAKREEYGVCRHSGQVRRGPEGCSIAGAPGECTGDDLTVDLIESPVMGADVWYGNLGSLRGYVAWQAETRRVTISLRPGTAAPGGLLSLVGTLNMHGWGMHVGLTGQWGGRPEIIGSPRGQAMTREDAVRAAQVLAERIDEVSVAR